MTDPERQRLSAAYDRRTDLAARYSPFQPGTLAVTQERERLTLAMLHGAGLEDLPAMRILEVGCGSGGELKRFLLWGADPTRLCGVEALPERAVAARHALPSADVRHADARELPYEPGSFDLVLALTLFSSLVDPAVQDQVASEAWRVIRPGGALLWYDMRMTDPRNRDLVPLGPARICALFPEARIELRSCTLLPPLARWLTPLPGGRTLHAMLAALPVLRGHLLGLIRKPATTQEAP